MRVLLIHGFEGTSGSYWLPWLQRELISLGHEVINLDFPKAAHPVLSELLSFYRSEMDSVDIIVGHSLGAFIALKLAEKHSLRKLILVAPVIKDLNYDALRKMWPESDVDSLESCVSVSVNFDELQVQNKVAFFSDDDPCIPLQHKEELDESWKCVVLSARSHFNQKNFSELLSQF